MTGKLLLLLGVLIGCGDPSLPVEPLLDAGEADVNPLDVALRDLGGAPDSQLLDGAILFDARAPIPDMAIEPERCETIAHTSLKRLTVRQYRRTVEQLLGWPEDQPLGLDPESGPVSLLAVEKYETAAKLVATTADLSPGALLPCDPTILGEALCRTQFLSEFGRRAFRTPVTPETLEWLEATWADLLAEDFTHRARLMLEVMLQSPYILYRVEFGRPGEGNPRQLSDYEVAARLSYAFWDAPPDAELRAAADAGELSTEAEVESAVERVIDDPRAQEKLQRFVERWLALDELDEITKSDAIPMFNPELRQAMRTETVALLSRTLFDAELGRLDDLLTSTQAYVNGPLATLYGIEGPAEGFEWRALDPTERAGVLTRAAFLTLRAGPDVKSPIHRGAFIRRKLLCLPLPPPPPTVNDTPITRGSLGDDGQPRTLRALNDRRTDGPGCQSCHRLFNPIGYTLENYDAIGRFEREESGVDRSGEPYTIAINSEGTLPQSDIEGPIAGGVGLSQALADSQMVLDCIADQWFTTVFERPIEADDMCSVIQLRQAFRDSGGDFSMLMRATATLPAFRYIRVEAP